jgi:predicted nucleic acid-binding protein
MSRPAAVLIDTGYVLALANRRDQWNAVATLWQQHVVTTGRPMIVTEYVLFEIGNGLSHTRYRQLAAQLIDELRAGPDVEIVLASTVLFDAALDLYRQRPDKDWGLTDCASFVVMQQRGLSDALTPDDHFRQAGFRALLLDPVPDPDSP